MARFLAIRFSAIGDVAMTVPVLASFAYEYPEHEIYMLSVRRLEPLFDNLADNLHFIGVDLKAYPGVKGLYAMFKELQKLDIDYVADLHGVLRTVVIRWLFKRNGAKTACICKGRVSKWRLNRRFFKRMYPIKTSIQRYHDVFMKLGFPFSFHFQSLTVSDSAIKVADSLINGDTLNYVSSDKPYNGKCETLYHVGMAPFASFKGKSYPLELMEQVISKIISRGDVILYFFGGDKDSLILNEWSRKYPHAICLAGRFSLEEELAVIKRLDVIVSMDSANAHLASLVGTPVVTIWGATHPFCGFTGWHEANNTIIQTDLKCRPCSVYGKRNCRFGSYACLNSISPEVIESAIVRSMKRQHSDCFSPHA